MKQVLLALDPVFDLHRTHFGHPEQPTRLGALADLPVLRSLRRVEPRPATDEELLRVHAKEYLDFLARIDAAGGGFLRRDTPIGPDSLKAARAAAGVSVDLASALMNGTADAAAALVRPPGHHACPASGMGFCVLNNAALAAAAVAGSGRRVAVFDWDVHHGNGVQQAFWESPDVLYVSMHQHPLYPYTGLAEEVGVGPGAGTTRNVPLPAGCRDGDYLYAFDALVGPALSGFAPDLLVICAGFDAHRLDPLGSMQITEGCFRELLRRARVTTSAAPVLLVLEGGYSIEALRACVAEVLAELVAPSVSTGAAPEAYPEVRAHVDRVAARWEDARWTGRAIRT